MVAEVDEPLVEFRSKACTCTDRRIKCIIKHVATARIFSNSIGSYSANIGLAIENGGRKDETQLQEKIITRTFLVFNADKPGMM